MSVYDAVQLATELERVAPDALVTLDPRVADNGLDRGRLVIVVNPPKLLQLTTDGVQADWEITAATGPAEDMVKAWAALDPVVRELLADGLLGATEAAPVTFKTMGGKDYPAYTLSLTTYD